MPFGSASCVHDRIDSAHDPRTAARPMDDGITLNDFERRLDPERFIRVDRAHIVNLDFVKQLRAVRRQSHADRDARRHEDPRESYPLEATPAARDLNREV